MTGAGKTVLLLRIAWEILTNTDFRLCVVDGKGSRLFASLVATLAYLKYRKPVPIIKVGWDEEGTMFNGFVGDGLSIYNRIAVTIGLHEPGAENRFHINIDNALLQLVCGVNADILYGVDVEPPRSFMELEQRLRFKWFRETYKNHPRVIEIVRNAEGVGKENHLNSFRLQMSSYTTMFARLVSPSGVWFTDHRVTILSLRTPTNEFVGKEMFKFVAECIKYFMGAQVEKLGYKFAWLMDEIGALGAENTIKVLSLGREHRVAVIMANQSLGSLGEKASELTTILDNTNIKFLMKMESAEDIIKRAGTRKAPEVGVQIEDGDATGLATVRLQDIFKINPNDTRGFTNGLTYVSAIGKVIKIQTAELQGLEENPDAIMPPPPSIRGEVPQEVSKAVKVVHKPD